MTKNHPRRFMQCLRKNVSCARKSQCCPGETEARPLSHACQQGKVRVCKVCGDRKNCAKMANLGVLPGTELELICPRRGRQCMIKVNGGTLSLDETTAENIFVTSV